mmetsp:Transcript_93124/g.262985  ORF Transcript_93124/g.262985 Transcript_93124/m.262985 type:complete len:112 (-) Transcript_93124:376-711(-)
MPQEACRYLRADPRIVVPSARNCPRSKPPPPLEGSPLTLIAMPLKTMGMANQVRGLTSVRRTARLMSAAQKDPVEMIKTTSATVVCLSAQIYNKLPQPWSTLTTMPHSPSP